MKFCPNCGTELQENEKFCHNCGVMLGQCAPAAEAPLEPDWEQGAERLRYSDEQPQQYQPQYQPQYQQYPAYTQQGVQPQQLPPKDRSICIVIKIFLILGCVAYGWMLLPLIWLLPITISICNKMKNGEPVGLGLKICALIFVNLIAGVCLLASDDV